MTLKITVVEGKDQFQAEGEETVVRALLTEWRARTDALTKEAWARVDAMTPKPVGPIGGGPAGVSPFPRKTS